MQLSRRISTTDPDCLECEEGQFLLIDAAGKTRLEGSLADSASVARIRSQLGQLGIR